MATNRKFKDAQLIDTEYLPAAAATNYCASFDLKAANAFVESMQVEVAVPACPNNTDNTKTIKLTLQHSSDNVTFADTTSPLVEMQIAGVAITGSAAVTKYFAIPSGLNRYIRFKQVVEAGGGDNTAVLVTYSLVF